MTDFSDFESRSDNAEQDDDHFACSRRLVDLTYTLDSGTEPRDPVRSDVPAHPEIIELIESMLAADPALKPSAEMPASSRVHAVYVPEHYEAGYAYPLVVWFHGDGESEADLSRLMPTISSRNYLGVALRGDVVSGSGYGWSTGDAAVAELTSDIRSVVTSLRRQYHIHSERIYLAGFGSGATTAIQLMLHRPEWFGGVISFSGDLPKSDAPLMRVDDLKNKRILLATWLGSNSTPVGDIVAAGRLLYSAGMKVGTRVYQGTVSRPTTRMLRDVDSWLMDDVCGHLTIG